MKLKGTLETDFKFALARIHFGQKTAAISAKFLFRTLEV